LHLFFRHHALSRTSNGRLGPGIDVKASGSYVVWWPSFGRKLVHDLPIGEWPDWLIAKQQGFSAQWLRSQICNSGVSGVTGQHTLVVNRNRTVLIYEV
jgi:hypothetical protein